MCTVTYIPFANNVFITSNRDEHSSRKQAIAPSVVNNAIYPVDATANGTWIAATANGNAIVLLNGAFTNHAYAGPYKKSRGLVLLDIIYSNNMLQAFVQYPLQYIEPFTIIIYENSSLYICRWDGQIKHQETLNAAKSYIWSSATLYSPTVQQQRQQWFANWLQTTAINSAAITNFHQYTETQNTENGLCINRNNLLYTVSITQVHIQPHTVSMLYNNLLQQQQHLVTTPLTTLANQYV